MDYVRGMDQLAGMEGWSEEKWWCGRAGGAAWMGDGGLFILSPPRGLSVRLGFKFLLRCGSKIHEFRNSY